MATRNQGKNTMFTDVSSFIIYIRSVKRENKNKYKNGILKLWSIFPRHSEFLHQQSPSSSATNFKPQLFLASSPVLPPPTFFYLGIQIIGCTQKKYSPPKHAYTPPSFPLPPPPPSLPPIPASLILKQKKSEKNIATHLHFLITDCSEIIHDYFQRTSGGESEYFFKKCFCDQWSGFVIWRE